MPKQIIHQITQIVTIFQVVDEDGNVIDAKRVEQAIQKFKEAEFIAAYNAALDVRQELENAIGG